MDAPLSHTRRKRMADLISRQMAIKALRKTLYKLEEEREEYYIKEKKVDEWFIYIRPNVQDMNDLDVETIDSLPSANPWHTGTPTEDGLYAVYYLDDHNPSATPYEVLYDGFLSPDGEGNWIDRDGERRFIDDDIVRWKKIEPYKEGKTNE